MSSINFKNPSNGFFTVKKFTNWVGEMAQQLRTLVALAEDWGSVPKDPLGS